jgi:triosephosphate isomerase (TIM)
MGTRKPIFAGNWKMHKNAAETGCLVHDLVTGLQGIAAGCEVLVAPPFTSIPAAVAAASGSAILVGGQNLHWEDKGAFTGEISGSMLKEAGCTHVIIGHSERRQYFGETDESVNLKIVAAMRNDLVPVFCLGETLEERDAGRTFDVVKTQMNGGMRDIRPSEPDRFVIAYEPVWAIGTGRTATPAQAQEVHAFLREELRSVFGTAFAERVRILYGGSVKPDNSRILMECADVDGGLVGGASLKAEDFLGIMREGAL